MQLNDLQPEHKNQDEKRVGRGGRRGKTSGRGHKGQKARAGSAPRPQVRDRIKKLPKLRGYNFNSPHEKPVAVNVGALESVVEKNDEVDPQYLVEHGLLKKEGGRIPSVKILGSGEIDTAITLTDCDTSASAKEKIEEAGGEVKTSQ